MKNKYFQTGLSLIEIMIALLIGALLIGGVLQIFIASQQTYRLQENLSRLQENGRIALDFIGRDVRMTSYWGCLARLSGDVFGETFDGISKITLKAAFVTTPTGTCGMFVDKTAAYYTDYRSTIVYSINHGVLHKCCPTNNGAFDLIEGIENMQVLYGVDTDSDGTSGYGTPNYYVPVNSVTNMEKVVSIRISLLAATLDDNLTSQPQTYTYNGITTTPPDRKIRRVFTLTIALRNRLR
jgi:type IV pilus assembly protein PilW